MVSMITLGKNRNKSSHESGMNAFFKQLIHTGDKRQSCVYIIDIIKLSFLRDGGFQLAESYWSIYEY